MSPGAEPGQRAAVSPGAEPGQDAATGHCVRLPGADHSGCVHADGREPDLLTRLAAGEAIGSHLKAEPLSLAARKQWLADHVQVRGTLTIDDGATRVLTSGGKSLLPIGVIGCSGDFERGAVVTCLSSAGREIARGLVNYSAQETQKILKKPSGEIESILGYVDEPELIHRDNLVLL